MTGLPTGVEIRLTGSRADVEALAEALTRHGERLGLAVVETSGWYPNRPRLPRSGQHTDARPTAVVEARTGRAYLHTHPAAVP